MDYIVTYHICEKSCNPSRAWSGLVYIELYNSNFPGTFPQIPVCLGVPRLLGNQVDIIPIGFNFIVSSSALVLGFTSSKDMTFASEDIGAPFLYDSKRRFIVSTSFSCI